MQAEAEETVEHGISIMTEYKLPSIDVWEIQIVNLIADEFWTRICNKPVDIMACVKIIYVFLVSVFT